MGDPSICAKCGGEHRMRYCQGHTKKGGPFFVDGVEFIWRQCGRFPNPGGDKCTSHGAGAPQVRQANARKVAEAEWMAKAKHRISKLPDADLEHPLESLLASKHLTSMMVRALQLQLNEHLSAGGQLYGPNHLGDGAPHVLVNMLRDWNADRARDSKLLLDAGIDERRQQLEESQLDLAFAAVEAGFAALGLDHASKQQFLEAMVVSLDADRAVEFRSAVRPAVSAGSVDASAPAPATEADG